MKKRKTLNIILVLFFCVTVFSCDIFNTKKIAEVIMVEGPHLEGGEETFSFSGTVRNIGNGKALFVRVIIELRNPDNVFLAQSSGLVDKTDLEPGESSAFLVTFEDPSYDLRDMMDESRTIHDITWSDED